MQNNPIKIITQNDLKSIKKHLDDYRQLLLKIEQDQKIRRKLKTNEGFELLEIVKLLEMITQTEEQQNTIETMNTLML